ncbi:MAG: hypothetical protein KDE14_03995 [Rhodobacteraceae bacterium]|nr:hypothetical protein [Paracoccaceae bacterium]
MTKYDPKLLVARLLAGGIAAFLSGQVLAAGEPGTCMATSPGALGVRLDAAGVPDPLALPCYPDTGEDFIPSGDPTGATGSSGPVVGAVVDPEVEPGTGEGEAGSSCVQTTLTSAGVRVDAAGSPVSEEDACPDEEDQPIDGGSNNPGDVDDGSGSSEPGEPDDDESQSVVFAGVLNSDRDMISVLRLANFSDNAGAVHFTIVDPETGDTVALWTSPEIEPYTAMQVVVADAVGKYAPTGTTLPEIIDIRARADFSGTIQHLIGNISDGLLINASTCGTDGVARQDRIAFMPDDTATVRSWMRIVNNAETEAYADVSVRDAATGIPAAIWISPTVPPGSSITVPADTIRSQAAIDAGLDPDNGLGAVIIEPATFPENMRLELVAISLLTGAVADQTVSCKL